MFWLTYTNYGRTFFTIKNSKDLHRHLLPNTNYVENRFVIPICVTLIDFTVILCRFVDKRFIRMFAKSDRFFAFCFSTSPNCNW